MVFRYVRGQRHCSNCDKFQKCSAGENNNRCKECRRLLRLKPRGSARERSILNETMGYSTRY